MVALIFFGIFLLFVLFRCRQRCICTLSISVFFIYFLLLVAFWYQ